MPGDQPEASAREAALESENSALKAEVAALKRRLGEDEGKPQTEAQAGAPATGTKHGRDDDGEERPKKKACENVETLKPEAEAADSDDDSDDESLGARRAAWERKLAKMPEWERALQLQKPWEETASLRPFCHADLAADDEAKRRDAREWYMGLKADYLECECRALGLALSGKKQDKYKRIAGWARYGQRRTWWPDGRGRDGNKNLFCVSTDAFPDRSKMLGHGILIPRGPFDDDGQQRPKKTPHKPSSN